MPLSKGSSIPNFLSRGVTTRSVQQGRSMAEWPFLPVIHAACGNRDAFTNRYVGEKLHEKRETLDSSSLSFSGEFCCRSMSPKRHRPVLLHFSNVLLNWPATKYLPWGRAPVVKNDCNNFRWLINMQNFAFHRFSHDVLQPLSYSCTEQVFSPWWCWNSRLVWVGVASHLTSHYRDRLAHRCQKAPCLVMYSSKTSSGHSLQSLQETVVSICFYSQICRCPVTFFPQTSWSCQTRSHNVTMSHSHLIICGFLNHRFW